MKTYNTNHSGNAGHEANHKHPHLRLIAATDTEKNNIEPGDSGRRTSVRKFLLDHLDDPVAAPIAAALASLRSDGSVDMVIADVEPEFADALADGLEAIAQRLRKHATHRDGHRSTSGRSRLELLLPVALASASYVNNAAWLDAVIVIAAHLSAFLFLPTEVRQLIRRR
ncbi:hypothetical protein F3J20_22645 [Paraburkholderia sp. Cy-641]|uniref:hypothetical protein n=1 Tax=Paraburkholderia sp. Cy-641 TaxID=2608337 RepID=UPI001422F405|nr:hypothetical protein [Paraburkholderia sp. Cy-641]NIF80157.1 hypothetical protein [Paraburkholderia sp. Cy-641]